MDALPATYGALLVRHVKEKLPLDEAQVLEFTCGLIAAHTPPEDLVALHHEAFDTLRSTGVFGDEAALAAASTFFVAVMDAYSAVWSGLRMQYADLPLVRAEVAAAERIAARLSRGTVITSAPVDVVASRQLSAEGSSFEVREVAPGRLFAAVAVYNATGVLGAQILALLQYGARALISAGASLDRLLEYLRAKLIETFDAPPGIDYAALYLDLNERRVEVVTAGALAVSIVGTERIVLRSSRDPLERPAAVSVQSHDLVEGEALVMAPSECAERWLRPERGDVRAQVHSLVSSHDFERENALVIVPKLSVPIV